MFRIGNGKEVLILSYNTTTKGIKGYGSVNYFCVYCGNKVENFNSYHDGVYDGFSCYCNCVNAEKEKKLKKEIELLKREVELLPKKPIKFFEDMEYEIELQGLKNKHKK